MFWGFLFCALYFVLSLSAVLCASPWSPAVNSQAQSILQQLTAEEKFKFVHGVFGSHIGNVDAVERLSIPPLRLEDGPQGVADETPDATQFPSALTVTASFDQNNYYLFGKTQAEEQKIKGTNILLGPMVNLARVPQSGRTFESVGEDPLVASTYAKYFVDGVQSLNIMGCIKHAFVNSQEYERTKVSEIVSERTVRELYYPAFQAAVDTGVGSAMCAYNRINGTHACENAKTIGFLKEEAGFAGFVMSDWYATHSTVASANSGLDQEMPYPIFFGENLQKAVSSGTVNQTRIDDMVLRILRAMIATNVFKYPPSGNVLANATSAEHNDIARKLSEDGTVLLKNVGGYLPLLAPKFVTGLQSIAVIGNEKTVHGIGSGGVIGTYLSTPYGGIANLLMASAGAPKRPLSCTFQANTDYYQLGDHQLSAKDAQECCATCTAQADCNFFSFKAPSHCWLSRNGVKKTVDGVTGGACSPLPLPIYYNSGSNVSEAVALSSTSNVTVVVVAITSEEGKDRPDLSLGDGQDELVAALANAGPIIVVIRSPGAVYMPWSDHPNVRSILWQAMPGQEGGNALANVLFGQKNPSGRLPLSFPKSMNDTWLQTTSQYPGVMGPHGFIEATYTEELLMGYRWFTTKNIRPLFSFGAGFSYTQFTYSSFSISGSVTSSSSVNVFFTITNPSSLDAEDVPQLYITYPDSAGEPKYVLRAFTKVSVPARQVESVTLTVSINDVQIWNTGVNAWEQVKGTFGVSISTSGPFDSLYSATFLSQ